MGQCSSAQPQTNSATAGSVKPTFGVTESIVNLQGAALTAPIEGHTLCTKSADGVWCVELKDAVDAGKTIAEKLPEGITHLRITNNAGLRKIECSSFLESCRSLKSIDLAPLSNVTTIGNSFLDGCSSLTSIDLAPLSKVTTIRNCFLYGCSSLTSIDLAPLSNVSTIGKSFLFGCSLLTSIDLAPLSNVTTIEGSFLAGCSSLTSIDLPSRSSVTTIRESFLSGCRSLKSIDLAPLSNVTTIGDSFLSGCSSLISIDLAPLSKVTTIGNYFLSSCSSLFSIDMVLHMLTAVGYCFLEDCGSLKNIAVSMESAAYQRLDDRHKNVARQTAVEKAKKAAAERAPAEKAAAEKAAAEKAAAEKAAAERKAAAEKAAAEKAAAEKAAAEKAAAEKAAAEKAAAEKKAAAEAATAEKAAADRAAAENSAAEKAAERAVAERAAAEKMAAVENVMVRFMSSDTAPPSIMPFDPIESFPDFRATRSCRSIVEDILLSGPSALSSQVKERAVGKVMKIADMHASSVAEDVGAGCGQSFDEVFAIVAYTADVRGVGLPNEDNLFVRLNAVLRSRDPEMCKPFLEYYFYLVNGLRKMPKVAVKTWRGIDKPITTLSKLYGVGRLLSWPQFTSTSTNQNVMKQFAGKANGSLLQFSLTSAVAIRDWSLIPDEDEYLILPNTVLKVTAVVTAAQAKELEGFDGVSVGGGHYDLIVVRESE